MESFFIVTFGKADLQKESFSSDQKPNLDSSRLFAIVHLGSRSSTRRRRLRSSSSSQRPLPTHSFSPVLFDSYLFLPHGQSRRKCQASQGYSALEGLLPVSSIFPRLSRESPPKTNSSALIDRFDLARSDFNSTSTLHREPTSKPGT